MNKSEFSKIMGKFFTVELLAQIIEANKNKVTYLVAMDPLSVQFSALMEADDDPDQLVKAGIPFYVISTLYSMVTDLGDDQKTVEKGTEITHALSELASAYDRAINAKAGSVTDLRREAINLSINLTKSLWDRDWVQSIELLAKLIVLSNVTTEELKMLFNLVFK